MEKTSILEESLNYPQILKRVLFETKDRAKLVRVTGFEVLPKGVLKFTTNSIQDPTRKFTQYIQMVDWEKTFNTTNPTIAKMPLIRKVRNALYGNLKIDCNCPSFLFDGYAYILSQNKAKYGADVKIPPNIRNPQKAGSCCKHLLAVLENVVFYAKRISEQINNDGTIKVDDKKKSPIAVNKIVKDNKEITKNEK